MSPRPFYASATARFISFNYTRARKQIFEHPFCGSILVIPELSKEREVHLHSVLSPGYHIVFDCLIGKHRRRER